MKSFFKKIAGRYIVYNFDEIIDNIDITRNYFFMNSGYTNTCYYGVRMDVYKNYLRNVYKSVDGRHVVYLEHLFHKTINENNIDYAPMQVMPIIKGQFGTSGEYLEF